MAVTNPTDFYREQTINTATPGMLIVMLFNGAVKNINLAIRAINEQNIEEAHNAIIKTENIYISLAGYLDEKVPISKNLKDLYSYIVDRLVYANMKKDISALHEVLGYSVEFRDIWTEAEKVLHIQESKKQ